MQKLNYIIWGEFIVAVLAAVVAICAAFMGTHETRYTLPTGETLAIETPTRDVPKAYINGRYIEGQRIDDNEIALWVSFAVFGCSTVSGIATLAVKEW